MSTLTSKRWQRLLGSRADRVFARGGSFGFRPTHLANLVAWYDLSRESFTDAEAIGTLTDWSGNSRDLTEPTTSEKPTNKTGIINSLPVARFDGTDDRISGASDYLSDTMTLFMVCQYTQDGVTANRYFFAHQSASGRFYARHDSSDGLVLGFGGTANIASGLTLTPDTPFILRVTVNDGAWEAQVNAGTVASGAYTSGIASGSDFYLGLNLAAPDVLKGDVGEVPIYDRVLTATELASTRTYLTRKWGVA